MAVESATAAAIAQQATVLDNRRQRWLVLATLFVVMLFLIGSTAMTVPIFFMPLIKQYGWSHARTSLLPTVFVLLLGGAAPIAGWLLDRVQARVVMGTGAAMIAAGLRRNTGAPATIANDGSPCSFHKEFGSTRETGPAYTSPATFASRRCRVFQDAGDSPSLRPGRIYGLHLKTPPPTDTGLRHRGPSLVVALGRLIIASGPA